MPWPTARLPASAAFTDDFAELREPSPGQSAEDTMTALRILRETAARQVTRELPPYTGPMTGDQLGVLGLAELAWLDRAAEAIGEVPGPRLAAARARRERRERGASRLRRGWPLAAVLVVQAGLSLRLVWSNTAYPDEALYLSAGHLELSHWIHGTPIPAFQTYFSGALSVYPPLGALADSAGGLAGARILSLAFMLAATCFGYGTTRRIFGQEAAWFAAALFAATGACQYLGAFATYDAMSLSLLATSTWLGVRASGSSPAGRLLLMPASVAVLVLADAAKYAGALFDPVVIAIVVLSFWRVSGRRAALASAVTFVGILGTLTGCALSLGGHSYWEGITFTTLTRATGTSPVFAVWWLALGWTGLIIGLGIIGVSVAVAGRDRSIAWTGVVLFLAIFLAPAEQAHIHTITSLFKHAGFGAWFTSMVAGLALASFSRAVSPAKAVKAFRISICVSAASFFLGTSLAWNQFHSWPDSDGVIAALRPVLDKTNGPVLVGDNGYFAYYYMRNEALHHQFWGSGFADYSELLGSATVPTEYKEDKIINSGYFTVIVLALRETTWIDRVTKQFVMTSGKYRIADILPYQFEHGSYEIWVRKGSGK